MAGSWNTPAGKLYQLCDMGPDAYAAITIISHPMSYLGLKHMQIAKLLAAFSIVLAGISAEASPILQLGITNGSYDSGSNDVITTDDIFTLNAYGKAKSGSAVSLGATYFISIAIMAEEALNPANFGSFMIGANTYTLADLVFGNPPFEADLGKQGGDLGSHDVYDTWFLQYAFQFSGSDLTADVNVENTPAFDPLANAGTDYYFKSFNVNTQGLFAGYNLHFDLFDTVVNKKGDVTIGGHAPFSHDASTAYISSPSSVPEPATLVIFAFSLAGLYFSRKLAWPVAQRVKK
jgi:hypothetical protein